MKILGALLMSASSALLLNLPHVSKPAWVMSSKRFESAPQPLGHAKTDAQSARELASRRKKQIGNLHFAMATSFRNVTSVELFEEAARQFSVAEDQGLVTSLPLYERMLSLLAIHRPSKCVSTFEKWSGEGHELPLGEASFSALLSAWLSLGDLKHAMAVVEEKIPRAITARGQYERKFGKGATTKGRGVCGGRDDVEGGGGEKGNEKVAMTESGEQLPSSGVQETPSREDAEMAGVAEGRELFLGNRANKIAKRNKKQQQRKQDSEQWHIADDSLSLHLRTRTFLPLLRAFCERSNSFTGAVPSPLFSAARPTGVGGGGEQEEEAEEAHEEGDPLKLAVQVWKLMGLYQVEVTEEVFVLLANTLAKRLSVGLSPGLSAATATDDDNDCTPSTSTASPVAVMSECAPEWAASALCEVLDAMVSEIRFLSPESLESFRHEWDHAAATTTTTTTTSSSTTPTTPAVAVAPAGVAAVVRASALDTVVDSVSGECLATALRLRAIGLSSDEAQVVRAALTSKLPPAFAPTLVEFKEFLTRAAFPLRPPLPLPLPSPFGDEQEGGGGGGGGGVGGDNGLGTGQEGEREQRQEEGERNGEGRSPSLSSLASSQPSLLRPARRFTVCVDAPNVAYCRQNCAGGKFSFWQIGALVEELIDKGEDPLIVIPYKYTLPRVPNHAKTFKPHDKKKGEAASSSEHKKKGRNWATQEMTEEDTALLTKWRDDGRLFVTPRGANDDWFWIWASVVDDEEEEAGKVEEEEEEEEEEVSTGGVGGGQGASDGSDDSFRAGSSSSSPSRRERGCGHRFIPVVTNDQMRDHWYGLVPPNAFARWKQAQMLRFDFSYTDNDEDDTNEDNGRGRSGDGWGDGDEERADASVDAVSGGGMASPSPLCVEEGVSEEEQRRRNFQRLWVAERPLFSPIAQATKGGAAKTAAAAASGSGGGNEKGEQDDDDAVEGKLNQDEAAKPAAGGGGACTGVFDRAWHLPTLVDNGNGAEWLCLQVRSEVTSPSKGV